MLAQIVLPLKALPAHFAAEGELRTLVRPLVDHQVVGLGEPALAVLAHELALRTQLASEVAGVVLVNLHHGEHFVDAALRDRLGGAKWRRLGEIALSDRDKRHASRVCRWVFR